MLVFIGCVTVVFFGFAVGTLLSGLADFIRCRSVGNEWAIQQLVCPRWQWQRWLATPVELLLQGQGTWRERWLMLVPGMLLAITWSLSFQAYALGISSLGSLLIDWVWTAALLLFAVTDAKWRILPVEIMAFVGIVIAFTRILVGDLSFSASVLGCLFATLFFGLQYWLSRGRWLGAGDPWMAAMIGAVLGWPLVGISVYFTYLFGLFVIAWALYKGSLVHRLRYPFGPLLAAGAFMAMWLGSSVLVFLQHL